MLAPVPPAALEQAPLGGVTYILRVLPVLLARNARLWLRFRVSMIMDVLGAAAQASVFFFLGTTLAANGQQAWQTNYTAFLAVGIVFNTIMAASLSGPYQSLSIWRRWRSSASALCRPPPSRCSTPRAGTIRSPGSWASCKGW
jgi:hypothetical protein